MARPLYRSFRWPAGLEDYWRAPVSHRRGGWDLQTGDTHWPTCLPLDRVDDLTWHPIFGRAQERCRFLADRVRHDGVIVTDEQTGNAVGLIVRAAHADVNITTFARGVPEFRRTVFPLSGKSFFIILADGLVMPPVKGVDEAVVSLARGHSIPVVRDEEEDYAGEMPTGEDAAALEGISL